MPTTAAQTKGVRCAVRIPSPAPVLINGNKTLRMAMIWTPRKGYFDAR
jgi:hypothetical protein